MSHSQMKLHTYDLQIDKHLHKHQRHLMWSNSTQRRFLDVDFSAFQFIVNCHNIVCVPCICMRCVFYGINILSSSVMSIDLFGCGCASVLFCFFRFLAHFDDNRKGYLYQFFSKKVSRNRSKSIWKCSVLSD